jgi:hypothetical protein
MAVVLNSTVRKKGISMSFDEQLASIKNLLTTVEQQGPANGIAEIAARQEERRTIRNQLCVLAREIRLQSTRLKLLPVLPDLKPIRWAQSVLAFPNGRILIIDTASPAEDAGVVHVLLCDFTGAVCYDRYVAPGYLLSKQAMQALGFMTQNLHEAPSLPQIWSSLLEALTGKYVVSYNLACMRRVLEKSAEQYELEPLAIIGDCLLQQCLRYFQSIGFVGLGSLCKIVGHPLPELPDCAAIDRAWGQLHLLQAMAQGINGESLEVSTLRERGDEIPDDLYDDLL